MAQAEEVPPSRIESAAVARRGDMDAFMELLVSMAGVVELDPKTRDIVFGQVLGYMGSDVARRAVRGWQYMSVFTLLISGAIIVWLINTIIQMQLQFLIWALTGGGG